MRGESNEPGHESFIGEAVTPTPGTFDTAMMATGIPGLPHRFTWRGTEYSVAVVLKMWKTVGQCESGANEMYVRRHWYRVKTTSGDVMTLYCDRSVRGKNKTKGRWVLYSTVREES